jgi:GNAT superfamily N-acetyltransferase
MKGKGKESRLVSDDIEIRRAAPDEIEEMVAIDVDACTLYVEAGLDADLGPDHPYSIAERACWTRCASEGNASLAARPGARPVGLLVLDRVDGTPYLEQLSIRRVAMRQGLGRRLLERAIEWAGGEPLWLTTYGHIPWNRPFYERHGFVTIPEPECPPWVVAILEEQRRALPAPEERVAMRAGAAKRRR